ncbi:hypothetical protein AQUCO_04200006v1 [Aquilegia coerulea]|uniref:Uncharacterized protein n=1 Tax=Aquilegia coerulea TaxID=218851 RepID=A0A2G5CQ55_AQUCA|nr:hypothetical protein AQUCO_04200006v1 [Aquilegia coerulea]
MTQTKLASSILIAIIHTYRTEKVYTNQMASSLHPFSPPYFCINSLNLLRLSATLTLDLSTIFHILSFSLSVWYMSSFPASPNPAFSFPDLHQPESLTLLHPSPYQQPFACLISYCRPH